MLARPKIKMLARPKTGQTDYVKKNTAVIYDKKGKLVNNAEANTLDRICKTALFVCLRNELGVCLQNLRKTTKSCQVR